MLVKIDKNGIVPWIKFTDNVCVITNGTLKADGRLIMVKGIARVIDDEYNIAAELGNLVSKQGNHCYVIERKNKKIISFPTKYDWRDKSDLELIEQSAKELCKIADKFEMKCVLVPAPGCECGGLH